ncbi:hypothetical protein EV379_0513 [Microterricola gilva]|uniref:Uncharacterized protein n=1 Tax=Microterricola gilva TaxID=393267 RepID=A0A4Q8AK65_9MICO|nr:hypothetical protein [Microterricola gilva]RZU64219.1 hypothetical protein EV379_0513 [Microterricola gilva]
MVAALRVVALLLAAFWAMLGFGVIDLSLLFFPNPVFALVMPLEVSWGSFVTFFLVVPLATTAVRPAAFWGAAGLGVIAIVALAVGAALMAYPPVLWMIAAVIVTVAAVLLLGVGGTRRGRIPAAPPLFGVHWLLLVLALAGPLLWVPYTIHAAQSFGVLVDDVTMGIDHWPVQAAAGVAVMLASLTAALVPRLRRLAVVAVAFCAAMIGVSAAGDATTPAATETVLWAAWCVSWGTAVALSAQTFTAQTFTEEARSASTPRGTKTAGPPEGSPAVVNRSD